MFRPMVPWRFERVRYRGKSYKSEHPPPYKFRASRMNELKKWELLFEGEDFEDIQAQAKESCYENGMPVVVSLVGSRGHGIKIKPIVKMYFYKLGKDICDPIVVNNQPLEGEMLILDGRRGVNEHTFQGGSGKRNN